MSVISAAKYLEWEGDRLAWIGPVFIESIGHLTASKLTASRYYLLPVFLTARHGIIHADIVRGLVDRLDAGMRIRETDSYGLPLDIDEILDALVRTMDERCRTPKDGFRRWGSRITVFRPR